MTGADQPPSLRQCMLPKLGDDLVVSQRAESRRIAETPPAVLRPEPGRSKRPTIVDSDKRRIAHPARKLRTESLWSRRRRRPWGLQYLRPIARRGRRTTNDGGAPRGARRASAVAWSCAFAAARSREGCVSSTGSSRLAVETATGSAAAAACASAWFNLAADFISAAPQAARGCSRWQADGFREQ